MINVGVIGCGKIAQVRHLPEYAKNEQCKIVAVYDLNQVRAKEIAEEYGAVACETYEQLLEMQDLDAVSVCVANSAHAEISIAALLAGKHVLCEKPMATTLEDCKRMVKTADRQGKFLMIGQNQRLAKAHQYAHELVADGAIGQILSFKTEFSHAGPETWSIDPGSNVWFFDKQKAALGVMADLGIHKTDLIQYIIGRRIERVSAVLTTLDKRYADGKLIGVDDNVVCIYQMDGGSIGTMMASWTNYGAENNSTVLYGTEGVLHIYEDPTFSLILEKKSGEKISYALDKIQTNDSQNKSGIIDLWIESLERNIQPEISGKSVLNAMCAVFAAIESARTGKQINIMEFELL